MEQELDYKKIVEDWHLAMEFEIEKKTTRYNSDHEEYTDGYCYGLRKGTAIMSILINQAKSLTKSP